MRCHWSAKPAVVIRMAIQSCHRSNIRIRLNPPAIARVSENMNPTGGHGQVSGHQRCVVHHLNRSIRSDRSRVAAIPLAKRLRAGIEPPLLDACTKGSSVKVPDPVGKQCIPKGTSGQPRAIDPPRTLASPEIPRALEPVHPPNVILPQFFRVEIPTRQKKRHQGNPREQQSDDPCRLALPPENHESGPRSDHAAQKRKLQEPAMNRIERDHDDSSKGTERENQQETPPHGFFSVNPHQPPDGSRALTVG